MQRTFHFPKGYCHGAPVRKMALLILSGVMLGCLATGAVAKTWVLSVAVAGSMTPDDEKYLYVPSYRFAQELAGKTGFAQNHMQQPSVPGEDIDLLFYGLAVTTDSALGGRLGMAVRHVGLDIQNADHKDIEVTRRPRQNSPFDSKDDLKSRSLSHLVERLQPEWDGLILVADGVEAKDFNLYDQKHRFVRVLHPVRMANQVNRDRLHEDMRNAAQEFVAYVDSQCQVDVPTARMLEETQKIYPQQDVKLEVAAKNAEKIAVAWGDASKESQAEGNRLRFRHAYQKPGKYTVEFRGIRGTKESASGKKTIVVLPLPPAPTVVVSDEAPRLKVGEEKMLLIRCSGEDFTGTIDLGVFGGRQELQRGQNISLKYDIAGSYDILVEARNLGGGSKKRINVTVEAADTVAEKDGPPLDVEGPEILPPVLDLYGLDVKGLDVEVTTYVLNTAMAELDFGDRSGPVKVEAGEFLVPHHYELEGEYTLTLTCEGGTPATKEVAVEAPVVEPLRVKLEVKDQSGTLLEKNQAGEVHVQVEEPVQFVAKIEGNAGKVQWQFGKQTKTGRTQWHTFDNVGTYTVKLMVQTTAEEEEEEGDSDDVKEFKVAVVVDEKPFPAFLLLLLLAVLGGGGWLGAMAVRRCPKAVLVDGEKAATFSLMKNEAILPDQLTKMGVVTLKADKKGIVAVKVANPGLKLHREPSGEDKALEEGKMVLLQELFGESKVESTPLTLTGPKGTMCKIEVK
ncbi:MAG: PKD domain-containing protein [Kiritimatiellae bacterium]|nr:PKD domain-containing protein [Kiritimatiellia bacterium]